MPGAKRRALKKLLNPLSSSPSSDPSTTSDDLPDSAFTTTSTSSSSTDLPASSLGYVPVGSPLGKGPGAGLRVGGVEGAQDSTDALIREMEYRQSRIGTGDGAELLSPNQVSADVNGRQVPDLNNNGTSSVQSQAEGAIPIPNAGASAKNHNLAPPPPPASSANSHSVSPSKSPSKRFSLSSLGFSRHNDKDESAVVGDASPSGSGLGLNNGDGQDQLQPPVSRTSTRSSLRKSLDFGSRKSGETIRPSPEELARAGGVSGSTSNGHPRGGIMSAGIGAAPPVLGTGSSEHREHHHHHHHHSSSHSHSHSHSPSDSSPSSSTGVSGGKKSSKQRFLDREARKKAMLLSSAPPAMSDEEIRKLEREKKEEEDVMRRAEGELGVRLVEIDPDGHCMYSAIADQLHLLGLLPSKSYQSSRLAAATYLRAHPEDFQAFLPSVLGEDMAGATDDGVLTDEGYGEYCRRVESSGDWGGEIEIQALSRHFNIPIHVIQRGPPMIIAHAPDDKGRSGPLTSAESLEVGQAVRISYHRRMYGLGEHYNSLHPDPEKLPVGGMSVA